MAKYSKSAGKKVETVMKEMKKGKLKSGSGQKVTDRKQAIAIGLSEARKKGAKVPAKKGASSKSSAPTKSTAKKSGPQRSASKKAAPKKSSANGGARKGGSQKSGDKATSGKSGPATRSSTRSAAPKKAAAKKAAPKKAAPKKAADKKTSSKSTAPKKSVSSSPSPRKGTMIRRANPAVKPGSSPKPSGKSKKRDEENEIIKPTIDKTILPDNDDRENNDFSEAPVEEYNATNPNVEEPLPHNAIKTEGKGSPMPDSGPVGDSFHGNKNPTSAKGKVKPSGKKPLYN